MLLATRHVCARPISSLLQFHLVRFAFRGLAPEVAVLAPAKCSPDILLAAGYVEKTTLPEYREQEHIFSYAKYCPVAHIDASTSMYRLSH